MRRAKARERLRESAAVDPFLGQGILDNPLYYPKRNYIRVSTVAYPGLGTVSSRFGRRPGPTEPRPMEKGQDVGYRGATMDY